MDAIRRIDHADKNGVSTQMQYEQVVGEMAMIRMEKSISYGDQLMGEPCWHTRMWLIFCNVYRKYNRLKVLHRDVVGKGKDAALLRDAYMDIANYCVMGIMELDKLKDDDGNQD